MDGIDVLTDLQKSFGNRIQIMPGSGIDETDRSPRPTNVGCVNRGRGSFFFKPVGIASCLTASLVLFQTTVAAADAPSEFRLKTPMPISFLVVIDDCQD